MNVTEIEKEVKNLLGEDRIEEAMDFMLKHIHHPEVEEDLLVFKAKLARMQKEFRMELIALREFHIFRNNVIYGLSLMLDDLQGKVKQYSKPGALNMLVSKLEAGKQKAAHERKVALMHTSAGGVQRTEKEVNLLFEALEADIQVLIQQYGNAFRSLSDPGFSRSLHLILNFHEGAVVVIWEKYVYDPSSEPRLIIESRNRKYLENPWSASPFYNQDLQIRIEKEFELTLTEKEEIAWKDATRIYSTLEVKELCIRLIADYMQS